MKEFFGTIKDGVQALVALGLAGVVIAALIWPETVGKRFGASARSFAASTGGDVKLATPLGEVSIKVDSLASDFSASSESVQDLQNRLEALEARLASLQGPVGSADGPGGGNGGGNGGEGGGDGDGGPLAGSVGGGDAVVIAPRPVPARPRPVQSGPVQTAYAQWVVFLSISSDQGEIRDQIARLRSAGVKTATALQVGESFRAGVIYPSETAAKEALPLLTSLQSSIRITAAPVKGDFKAPSRGVTLPAYPAALSVVCPAHRWIDLSALRNLYTCT